MLPSLAFLRGVPSLHTEASGFAPPDAFGPFRVLHQIGAGALGPVFRAFDPAKDRLVAVKLFRLDLPPTVSSMRPISAWTSGWSMHMTAKP